MALNCLMHQSIDHHHPPPQTRGRVVDSLAIEQFVYFDLVATLLGEFEVDLPRQSLLRGKFQLVNQLVVATVWGSRGWGRISELQTKFQVMKFPLFRGGEGVEAVVMLLF